MRNSLPRPASMRLLVVLLSFIFQQYYIDSEKHKLHVIMQLSAKNRRKKERIVFDIVADCLSPWDGDRPFESNWRAMITLDESSSTDVVTDDMTFVAMVQGAPVANDESITYTMQTFGYSDAVYRCLSFVTMTGSNQLPYLLSTQFTMLGIRWNIHIIEWICTALWLKNDRGTQQTYEWGEYVIKAREWRSIDGDSFEWHLDQRQVWLSHHLLVTNEGGKECWMLT